MKVIDIAVNFPSTGTGWFEVAYSVVEYVRSCLGVEDHPKNDIPTNWCIKINNNIHGSLTLHFIFNEKNEKFASMFKMKYG